MAIHKTRTRTGVNGGRMAMRLGRVLCGLLLAVAIPADAGSPMTMTVSPAMTMGPATVKIRLKIEPDASNRSVTIVADSPDFYRSSLINLEGERAPRNVALNYYNLPGGNYLVSGTLIDNAGKVRVVVRRDIVVISEGED